MVIGPNTTGWQELMDTNVVGAVYLMYNTAFAGFVIIILFVVYQFMLYMKTKNLQLCFATSLMFASLYISSVSIDNVVSVYIMFLILVIELAGIIYMLIWK